MDITIGTTSAGRIGSSAEQMDLHTAAERGDTDAIRALIGSLSPELRQASLNTRKEGDTPLHCAAAHGHAEAVRLLVELGANPNIKTGGGWTPLHKAATYCHVSVIQILLSSGADPNVQGDIGENTPLHYVVSPFRRNPATQIISSIQALVTSGASLNIKECFGKTPLSYTLVRPHCDSTVILELIRRGAHAFVQDTVGSTPFHHAAKYQGLAVLVALNTAPVPADPRPHLKDKDGETPVDVARQALIRLDARRGGEYFYSSVPAALEYMRSTQGAEDHYGPRQSSSVQPVQAAEAIRSIQGAQRHPILRPPRSTCVIIG
jgi:ankyrin repeat protein